MTTKLPTYDKYKPSGVEWLGEIPEHWEVKRLKFVLREVNERSETGDEELLSLSKYLGVIPKSSLEERAGQANSLVGYKKVYPECLVINKMQAVNGLIGVSKINGITSPDYSVYKSVNSLYSIHYFGYLLSQPEYLAEYKKVVTGVMEGFIRLYTNDLFNIFSHIPPLPEQTAIAQFLDRKTALIDQAIDIKQKQIELLKERRQILIHQAVTRGLNPEVKMKDSGVEWIGEVPEHWEIVPIRRLVDVRDGTHDTPLYVEDSIDAFPLVTSKDFEGDLINFENIKRISKRDHINISKRSGVKKGDVLMSMIGGNIGKSVIINDYDDFSVKNVALFRTLGDLSLAKFLRFYFESGLLQKQIELKSRGGAQGFLSLGDIRNLIFFKIPIVERNKIVEHLEMNVTGKIDTAITLKQQEILKLQEYKATLINSAVTGKIKVGSHAQ